MNSNTKKKVSDYHEDIEEIQKKFKKLIELGIEEGKQLCQNKFQCSMDTPYEYYKLNDDFDKTKQPTVSIEVGKLKQFAEKLFRHYDVNPSIKGYNNKILETYVQQVKPIKQLDDLDVANENGVSTAFYTKIKQTLTKIKQGDPSLNPEDKTIHITGIRGSGKTAFFNYFISKYEEELNRENVITVRINVMKILGDTTLVDAINFKICRILFTYYCTWGNTERLEDRIIKDYLDPILTDFKTKRGFDEKEMIKCHDYFCEYNHTKNLRNIPSEYIEICQNLLQEISKQYKFIIMLDNFDQLNPNKRSKEGYGKRKQELEELTTQSIFSYCLFIIAVRYSTYKGLTANGNKKTKCWAIGSPITSTMIKKRMNYFNEHGNYNDEEKVKNEEFITQCIRLVGSSFTIENKILDFESACEVIDSIYMENKRIILNIINRFLESIPDYSINNQIFNDSFLTRYEYKFFESLLIKTQNDNSDVAEGYCRAFYQYVIDNNDVLKFGNINQTAHYDNSYLPNIYRFPANAESSTMMFIPFLKIRILQLLKNNPNLSTKKVCDILQAIFSYKIDAVELACIELREDQSLILRNETYEETADNEEAIRNIRMQITNRGKKLLEILPINVNLLAVSLEQMFFPERYLNKIPIGNYYTESDFIIRNIFCSLPSVIGLFRSIEEQEKEEYEKIQNNEESRSYFNLQNDFSFTEQLEREAHLMIEKIIISHFIPNNSSKEAFCKLRRDNLNLQLSKAM